MKRILLTLSALLLALGSAAAHGQAVAQSHTLSAASTNATQVTTGKAMLMAIDVSNHNAASRFLKFSDSSASPTCGTTAVTKTIEVPGVGSTPVVTAAHVVIPLPTGLVFKNGITFCITGAIADNDTTAIGANDVIVNLDYR